MKYLIAGLLTLTAFSQIHAESTACEQQLKQFLTSTYKSSDLLSNKKIERAADLFWLDKLEKKVFKDFLISMGIEKLELDGRNLYSISLRVQTIAKKKWLTVRVISDGSMGLAQGLQVYEWSAKGLTAKAQILDDHFNPPQYRCM
ncbi:hypothetical protein N9D31_04200 [Oligoflexaceae bacterium]|nr:hypothetical protein [Oligoflexaceae bacterium]